MNLCNGKECVNLETRLFLSFAECAYKKDYYLVSAGELVGKVGKNCIPVVKRHAQMILHKDRINSFLEAAAMAGYPDWSPKEFS